MGEKELVISTPTPEEYIEGEEEALETSFQALEISNSENINSTPATEKMKIRVMIKEGYQPGKGLGPHLNGIPTPITGRAGLGYQGGNQGEHTDAFPNQSSLNQYIPSLNGNAIPMDEDPSQTDESIKDDEAEIKALVEIEKWIEQEKPKFQPWTEELENINLDDEKEKKEVKVGKQMPLDLKIELMELLKEYANIVWSYCDMPGLDQEIMEHKLPLLPNATPVRQQLRRMKPSVALKIKEEVEKQWNAGFLAVSNYPQWVANIVPVPKKDGKDLNCANPKDNFPLPHIDVLVDNTTQHAFFSVMDGFSGYNQILMAEEDREKTTFITFWGTFCYKVMPFGLKNAGVTYQRVMVTLFHDTMHKEIEVYVDDMIAKLKSPEQHLKDLRKLFARLCKYRLRLNPTKCTFGVKTGKLLGFVVNERGIKIDPDKVKAIKEMPIPKTDSENPLVLVPAVQGRPLTLYLTVLDESMGCMLGQQDEAKKERVIYYLSKKFTDCGKKIPNVGVNLLHISLGS
ncbi:hypothetical protein CR513_02558, partial [Mucuna pruriens]